MVIPAQASLDRLKAANAKLYRTDLQGEITITTKGKRDSSGNLTRSRGRKKPPKISGLGREGQRTTRRVRVLSPTEILDRRQNRSQRRRGKSRGQVAALPLDVR